MALLCGSVIARVWHGKTSRSDRASYLAFVKKAAVKEFKGAKGNLGAYILVRDSEDSTEFLVMSFWESMKAIRGFAGGDPDKPVYFAQDSEYLLRLTSIVKHYKVAAKV
jgi:heme-degrading monooxygenase HmoA